MNPKRSLTGKLGRFSAARPWWVIIAWVIIAAGVVTSASLVTPAVNDNDSQPNEYSIIVSVKMVMPAGTVPGNYTSTLSLDTGPVVGGNQG